MSSYYARFVDVFHESLLSAVIPRPAGNTGENIYPILAAAVDSVFPGLNPEEEELTVRRFPRLNPGWVCSILSV